MGEFRKFAISDIEGNNRIDLNDFNGYLATEPTGLGIYRTSEYISIGNERIIANNKANFNKITLTINILGNRNEWEERYKTLRDFISYNIKDGFRFYYKPDEEERYIRCSINIVDKTEKSSFGLPIKLEIQPLTLWLVDTMKATVQQNYEANNVFAFIEREDIDFSSIFMEDEDLVDDLGRDFYSMSFDTGTTQVAVISNYGNEETPLKIRLYGSANNPSIKLKRYGSGEIIQTINFIDTTITDGYFIEIDADPVSMHTILVNKETNEFIDYSDKTDISSNMYMMLPVGDWTIEVTDDSLNNVCYTEVFYSNQYYGG